MDQEDIQVLKIIKDNIGWCVAILGLIGGYISACYSLHFTLENMIKSRYYNVDFNLYHLSFDIYKIVLILLYVFLCWKTIDSLKKSGGYLLQRFISKKNSEKEKGEIPTCHLILGGIFIVVMFIFLLCDWKKCLCLFINILIYYFLFAFLLFLFKFGNKIEEERDEKNFNFKKEILHIIQVLAIIMCIEVVVYATSVYFSLRLKKDYFIKESNGQIEVVIETYPDYYIMKKARIDDNNLIIIKDSQSIKSTFDTEVNKRSFNKIYFE